MKAIRLRTEYLKEPLGLGTASPRFYWNCEGGVTQTAYKIVAKLERVTIWDSGKVLSSRMAHIAYEGAPLHSRDRVEWSVTLWDENDQPGEIAESWFELGLLETSDWTAMWISGDYKPNKKERYPVDCFCRTFSVEKPIAKARLYASARGVYDVAVNGKRIEEFIFAPGMTDYRKRIQYQTYDVTSLMQKENKVELRLADGWYRGSSAAYGVTNVYGTQTSVIAQLEITLTDGTFQTYITDDSWKWSNDGPIRFADMKDGEVYDARKEPGYDGTAKIAENIESSVKLTASNNVPVREKERFTPVLLQGKNGVRVLDFGQNIAGYLEFTVKEQSGSEMRLICGEVLDKDGRVDLSGIQESRPAKGWSQMSLVKKLLTNKVSGESDPTPRQEIRFICSGGKDHYKTGFAVFGFRYAQVEGDVEVCPEDFRAIAVYSDMEETGGFVCSDERINRLVENTKWSMKGNFLDIPTDCPTRERLGWTGDAQIFFDTGAYLMDTAAFFGKWLKDMEDAQYKDGLLPAVLPYQGVEMMYKSTGSSVGWADAVYLIPYRYYKRYGDKSILERTWPMVEKYAEYLMTHMGMKSKKDAKTNPHNAYTYEKGVHLGEWLEPEEFRDKVYGTQAKHPEECTAYLYYAMETIGEIADILGKDNMQERCRKTARGAKKAYDAMFVKTGTLDTDRQAKLVRPLALGLLDGETKKKAQERLTQAVEHYNYRVGTGFLSTPFLLPVLTEAGEVETAYKMLENTEKPGWLAEVLDGATTVWENWEGNLSQNHYSPGAVCQWMFDTVAGIRVEGENRLTIAPMPGGSLKHACAEYISPYGKVVSRWEETDRGTVYTVEIPANVTAKIILPDGRSEAVGSGVHTYLSEYAF
ncbi:MAG: family 78 glycoside hydrolase catalytic domain [Lachnospiraceae bacterium]|nr:family 78 glycoside hydrolase catalytic domain [Lachnospiraceae bacterium]